mmetsp:Transcript_2273/g.8001  ORF Transcript_2273/g.8001 Transcript_2273/m.8001 type:complete len:440 (+) Transcript_2273:3619-4938(+)
MHATNSVSSLESADSSRSTPSNALSRHSAPRPSTLGSTCRLKNSARRSLRTPSAPDSTPASRSPSTTRNSLPSRAVSMPSGATSLVPPPRLTHSPVCVSNTGSSCSSFSWASPTPTGPLNHRPCSRNPRSSRSSAAGAPFSALTGSSAPFCAAALIAPSTPAADASCTYALATLSGNPLLWSSSLHPARSSTAARFSLHPSPLSTHPLLCSRHKLPPRVGSSGHPSNASRSSHLPNRLHSCAKYTSVGSPPSPALQPTCAFPAHPDGSSILSRLASACVLTTAMFSTPPSAIDLSRCASASLTSRPTTNSLCPASSSPSSSSVTYAVGARPASSRRPSDLSSRGSSGRPASWLTELASSSMISEMQYVSSARAAARWSSAGCFPGLRILERITSGESTRTVSGDAAYKRSLICPGVVDASGMPSRSRADASSGVDDTHT